MYYILSFIFGVVTGLVAMHFVNQYLKKNLENQSDKLQNLFNDLAQQTLKNSQETFLNLAESKFENLSSKANKDLDLRKESIQSFVKNLQTNLERQENLIKHLEHDRSKKYGAISGQLQEILMAEKRLQETTKTLETALTDNKKAGNWGEVQLKRVVEMAGLMDKVDFTEQTTFTNQEGSIQRPDMIVNLPDQRKIIIDAKAPLANFLKASNTDDKDVKEKFQKMFIMDVKKHMNTLDSKAYQDSVDSTAPFVIMFLPGEYLIRKTMELDPQIMDYAINRKIILASPATLLSILIIIEKSWKDDKLSKRIQEVKVAGQDLISRLQTFTNHLSDVGKGLQRANKAFASLSGSWNRNLVPQIKKFNALRGHKNDVVTQLDESLNVEVDNLKQIQ